MRAVSAASSALSAPSTSGRGCTPSAARWPNKDALMSSSSLLVTPRRQRRRRHRCFTSAASFPSSSSPSSASSSSLPMPSSVDIDARRTRTRAISTSDAQPSSSSSSSLAQSSFSSSRKGLELDHEEEEEPPLIELVNVSKSFGSKRILRGATIKIRRGEAVGIIGGSGTGKSTTLRLMAGLLAPDSGEVKIKGIARKGLLSDDPSADERVRVGLVFQSGALFDSLTVGENVGFLLYEHSDLPEERVRAAVADALASVGLSGVEGLYPAELSGGMRKRVALARAIVRDRNSSSSSSSSASASPSSLSSSATVVGSGSDQVIMYDEPTAGLDPVASTVIEDLIRSLGPKRKRKNKDAKSGGGVGRSFFDNDDADDADDENDDDDSPAVCAAHIVVTHQHSTIRRAVDRLVFLHQGVVAWEGTVEEFDSSDAPIVRQFRDGSLDGPIKYE